MASLSAAEKRQLNKERQAAVRNAWKAERQNVLNGKASRDWTPAERSELINKGSVSGYEGHHMKSVSEYPKFAGDPNNIQFLTHDEHLNGAHKGSYHNPTNGYFDYKTGKMQNFNGNELKATPKQNVSKNNTTKPSYSKKSKPTKSQSFNNSLKSSSKTSSEKSSVSKSFAKSISSTSGHTNSPSGATHSVAASHSSGVSSGQGHSNGSTNGGHGSKH